MTRSRFLSAACALALAHCSPAPSPVDGSMDATLDAISDATSNDAGPDGTPIPPDAFIPPRRAGERAPRTAACDDGDSARCLLPYPSNVFTRADPATATGLRLQLSAMTALSTDDPALFARADGFSRVTVVATSVPGGIDTATLGADTTGALRLVVAQPGATFGQQIPLRIQSSLINPNTMLVGLPRVILDPATDYIAVSMDSVRARDGSAIASDPATAVALGLRAPATLEELSLAAYYAPAREALMAAGIDRAHVLRVWDFTTRSRLDPRSTLRTMRDAATRAVAMGTTRVVIDEVLTSAAPSAAVVVLGRLSNVPMYLNGDNDARFDAAYALQQQGTHDAVFRVAIPRGTGDYRVVMFGHGAGGSVRDDSFDAEITGAGAMKLGIEIDGWTETELIPALQSLETAIRGSARMSMRMAQSIADACALRRALEGPLADALSAPMLGTMVNPAAGRRPMGASVQWVGGSLGGTIGLTFSRVEDTVSGAVLNVPGAALTHYLSASVLYATARAFLRDSYRTDGDALLAVLSTQTLWDDVDGAAWSDGDDVHTPPMLLQQSMGDPVLPAIGNEMAAVSAHARQVGAVLSTVPTITSATEVRNGAGFTQYRVPSTVTAPYDVHGFGARDSIAGLAARQQITSFLQSVWAGAPLVTVPPLCASNTPANSCDFSASTMR